MKQELFPSDEIIPSDDIVMLESLIKSPAFGALKRVLKRYKDTYQSQLLTASDLKEVFGLQGRIVGMTVVEELPRLLVQRRADKIEQQKQLEQRNKPKKPMV